MIHIHQHLDLLIDGKKQQVPKDIGISPTYGFLTSLHTHSDDGIMHVESPTESGTSPSASSSVCGREADARLHREVLRHGRTRRCACS